MHRRVALVLVGLAALAAVADAQAQQWPCYASCLEANAANPGICEGVSQIAVNGYGQALRDGYGLTFNRSYYDLRQCPPGNACRCESVDCNWDWEAASREACHGPHYGCVEHFDYMYETSGGQHCWPRDSCSDCEEESNHCEPNVFLGFGIFVLAPVLLMNVPPAIQGKGTSREEPLPGGALLGIRCFMGVFLSVPLLSTLAIGCWNFTAIYLLVIIGVPVRDLLSSFFFQRTVKFVWVTAHCLEQVYLKWKFPERSSIMNGNPNWVPIEAPVAHRGKMAGGGSFEAPKLSVQLGLNKENSEIYNLTSPPQLDLRGIDL